ncbi:reverse transcriptase domain-containing protein, partial [Tanacetum coccineum]
LEKSINQSNLEGCGSLGNKSDDDYDLEISIRRIDSFNTPYSVTQETTRTDGVERFFQILIAPEDQEKTTFTCPYGTFAYRRMSFGLCNAPVTFQRCMTAIFHDMVEDFMEVFMDDFLVFGIEVDRAKIDVIAKLPCPTNVKGVRNIKFDFSDDCKEAFNILKEKSTTTPIIISPDWNVPFELMGDTSDFVVGAVLGQRIDGKFEPIYYASKTLNNAQEHYTTTKKELLAVDVELRLIRWVLLLQGFYIEIKDKKGAENLAADHLSRLENPDLGAFTEEEIADEFPNEHLMILKSKISDDEPWYADYVNYIVGKIMPPKWTSEKRRRFSSQVKNYF